MKDQQTRIDGATAVRRHVINVIHRFVHSRIGVKVSPKFHTDCFEIGDDSAARLILRKMFGTVESHVFEEVGQSALVLLFKNRPHALHDVEVRPVFGQFVSTDVVSQSVFEVSDAHLFVHRNSGHLLRLCSRKAKHGQAQQHVFELHFHSI